MKFLRPRKAKNGVEELKCEVVNCKVAGVAGVAGVSS
jgi:hypothetical protein